MIRRSMTFPRRFLLVAALLLLAAVCAAYAPYAGNGFKQDDFGWVASSRVRQLSDWPALFARNTGFYRPAVAITFSLDELLFGMKPLGYGLTNLALLVACLLAIAGLARSLDLPPGAALAAGGIWALNLQGINMAVVWTSGRTALVLVLFAALAARAFARGHRVAAAVFTLLALLSKEEGVMLPVLLFAWAGLPALSPVTRRDQGSGIRGAIADPDARTGAIFCWRRAVRATWPLLLPLAVYAALRYFSGAFGPLSAPPYYRMTLAPSKVADNAIKYLDFAATWPAALVALAAALAGVVPRASQREGRIVWLGCIWLVAGYAVTVFLPIRSPLYACFPVVGAALAASALLSAVWLRSSARARFRLAVVALVLPFALLPVYWARNVRHAKGARLSAQWLHDLEAARPQIPADALVVLLDDPRLPPTERLPAAFGTLYDIAVRDTLGRPTQSWMEPPPNGWELSGLRRPDPAAKRVVFALRDGHLVRVAGDR